MGRAAQDVRPDYPSRQLLDRAIRSSGFDVETRAVLWAFMAYVNEPHGLDEVWVAMERLHAETGMFKDRITKRINVLIKAGWFEVARPGAGRRPTSYRIVLPLSADGPDATSSRPEPLSTDHPDATGRGFVPVVSGSESVASGPRAPSVRTIGRERKNEGTQPPGSRSVALDPRLVAALREDGITSPEDVAAVLAIAERDPGTTTSVSGRLINVPSFRWKVIAALRAQQAADRRAAHDALPTCDTCGKTVEDCDRLAARDPEWCDGPEQRASEGQRRSA